MSKLNLTAENYATLAPTAEQLRAELNRVQYRSRFKAAMRSTVYTLITVSAIAVLVAVLLLPVLQIYGTSMSPTLVDGNIVITVGDDGMGFDVSSVNFDDANHIGIKNVTDRFRSLLSGSVSLASAIGEGTTVTIRFPRSEEQGGNLRNEQFTTNIYGKGTRYIS